MNISVYITSYNQKDFLREAIESVLDQTLMPTEILIVDDASTDGSQDLIREYQSQHPHLINFHFNDKNLGITKSRNVALSLVKGDYITGLDGDDAFLPRKLEIQKQLVLQTGASLVFTNFYYAEDVLDNLIQIWCRHKDQLPRAANLYEAVLCRNFPDETLFRSELFAAGLLEKIGGYDENLQIYEDFEFKIRLSKIAKAAYSIEPLTIYRLHVKGLSRKAKELHLKSLSYIYKKHGEDIDALAEASKTKIKDYLARFEDKEIPKSTYHKPSLLKRVLRKITKM